MASRSIPSAYASPSSPTRRNENNNYFSKIIRVALATLGTIASYAFLPPIGATAVSAGIIIATIISFFKSNSSDASSASTGFVTIPPALPRRPWYAQYNPFAFSSFPSREPVATPSPMHRRPRLVVRENHSAPRAPTRPPAAPSAPFRDYSSSPPSAPSAPPLSPRAVVRIPATDRVARRNASSRPAFSPSAAGPSASSAAFTAGKRVPRR
ncbi:MAG: hypothetical protein K1060chlam1_00783 [Candidatus Anoxychlamydiales bacterium]|nr:hypothetical protein [Candidatus Anoxychlamydiales bacterium]